MKLKIYSVRDQKAEVYNTPFFQKTHGEAERNFMRMAQDSKTLVAQYPKDFDLYYLGEYDDNLGTIESIQPEHVMSAIQCVNTTEVQVPQNKTSEREVKELN
jgi:hypothetical protein